MASSELSDLTDIGTWAGGDLLYVVDVSDTSADPAGTSKRGTVDALSTYLAQGATDTLQYNDGAGFSGTANVFQHGGGLRFTNTTTPSTPAGGSVAIYGKTWAGAPRLTMLDDQGSEIPLQGQLGFQHCHWITPANGTTAPRENGGVLTTATTISHQQTIASANVWQGTRRTRFQTSTTAGTATGMRTAYTRYFLGNAAGFGGFLFIGEFGQNINLNGGQTFFGLCSSTGVLAGDPSALTQMIGMGYDAGDSSAGNWFFMRNDGAGVATKVDLGTNAPRNTTHGYQLIMYAKPNSSEVFVRIRNLDTGTVVLDTSYTTDIPAANTGLAFKAECRNGAVSAAHNIEVATVMIYD